MSVSSEKQTSVNMDKIDPNYTKLSRLTGITVASLMTRREEFEKKFPSGEVGIKKCGST